MPAPHDQHDIAATTDASRDGLADTDIWDRMAARLDAFATAWEDPDDPPSLRDFLPNDHGATVRHAALLELIKLDMECQWNLGAPKWVEDYLEEFTELGGAEHVPLDLVVQEIHIRQGQGRNFEPDEYLERFPQAAQRLRSVLEAPQGCASASLYSNTMQRVGAAIAKYHAGDELDDFELVNQLGSGSFATVFLAWQRSMQRWVALKLSAAEGDEPQTLAQLQHAFIVRVYDVRDIEDGLLRLLYMEYVAGGTLQGILSRLKQMPRSNWSGARLLKLLDETLQMRHESPPRDSLNRNLLAQAPWPETVCIIGSHLALAVSYAHDCGVLHRDIKPANILVSGAAFPKLADFNVSFGSEVQGSTAAAHFGGSMAYMSPEQLDAMHPAPTVLPEDLDGTSDIYALGIVLWEMLTGERPFDSAPDELGWVDAAERLSSDRRAGIDNEKIAKLPGDAPPAVKPLLLRCLAPLAGDRFADAKDLARQLLLCLHDDVQRLLWTQPTGWLRRARRFPMLVLLGCILVPNLFFSTMNIAYNAYAAGDWAPPGLFEGQVAIVNVVAYVVGVGLYVAYATPIVRMIHAARIGATPPTSPAHSPDVLITRTLRLGGLATLLTVVLWTCCGFVFPVWTHVVVGQAELSAYGHFFLSQVICGALVGLIELFLITLLATRAWIPMLLSPRETSAAAADVLRRLPPRTRVASAAYAMMPSLCLLLLSLSDVPLRFPFLVLGLFGGVGFLGILWLAREIGRDAAALQTALSPDPAGASEADKPGVFEMAKSVWASVRPS